MTAVKRQSKIRTANEAISNLKFGQYLDYPISGIRPVNMIITDLAVFEIADDRLILIELLKGMTLDQLRNLTDAKFETKGEVDEYQNICSGTQ